MQSLTASESPARHPEDEKVVESMLTLLRDGADVRQRKVRRVRAAVRVKAYENPLKLAIAIDRLVAVLES